MRIVVLGGTGQVGRMVVERLQRRAQAVVVASPTSGVDARTGLGLDAALEYADAVVDVTDAPDHAGLAARAFFEESTRHLLDAGIRAGVKHHVVLSIVGADRVDGDGYFGAKHIQERIVQAGSTPYSILRSTQFYDFARVIAQWNTTDDTIRLPAKPVQPVAASDVADALVDMAMGEPIGGAIDMGGPERMPLPEFVHRVLRADHDPRYVIEDDGTIPNGFNISGDSLLPHDPLLPHNFLRSAPTSLDSWVHEEGRRRLVASR